MAVYEFDGEKYKKASRHQKEWGKHLIAELYLKGDETVLDLGCGDGMLCRPCLIRQIVLLLCVPHILQISQTVLQIFPHLLPAPQRQSEIYSRFYLLPRKKQAFL